MPLIDDDHGPNEPKRIPETLLHRNPAEHVRFTARKRVRLEIRHGLQQLLIGREIIDIRIEGGKPPRVPKEAELLFGLAGRRLEHEHHDTEMLLDVSSGEGIRLFEKLHPAAGCALEELPVRMLPVREALPGLAIDRVARHDPEHEASLLAEIIDGDALDRAGGEKRLPSRGRHLEAHIRDRTIEPVAPVDVGRRCRLPLPIAQHRKVPVGIELLPGVGAVVSRPGILAPRALEFRILLGLLPLIAKRAEISADPLDDLALIVL